MEKLPTLGIIAGGGSLPGALVANCRQNGREFFILSFDEKPGQSWAATMPHAVVRIGAVGQALAHLRAAGVREIVMAGHMKRPSLAALKPDAQGAILLKKLGKAFFSGDDALLRAITSFFEEEGFAVVGVDSILGGLLAPEGCLSKATPGKQQNSDILLGLAEAKKLGQQDIGQAVAVAGGRLLARETETGTDAMLRNNPHAGAVLVKAKKPGQEERVDLPSIGPQTIENLHKAGYAGVAVEAGSSLIIEKAAVISKANEYGIFVVGVRYG